MKTHTFVILTDKEKYVNPVVSKGQKILALLETTVLTAFAQILINDFLPPFFEELI